ncbi:hypothetical protein [Helicobacter trogontum]|uniref:hypothetical protein n=1 Tax=Helicobacter trogontum TaxID=50960 RepID=UPI000CF13749|nr:hypothetical protein [Helicobacter trogontum]
MNHKSNTQDSMINPIQELDMQISQTYHEVLINVECKRQFLQDIIMQGIADIILEHGDGVEFIDNVIVTQECNEYNA